MTPCFADGEPGTWSVRPSQGWEGREPGGRSLRHLCPARARGEGGAAPARPAPATSRISGPFPADLPRPGTRLAAPFPPPLLAFHPEMRSGYCPPWDPWLSWHLSSSLPVTAHL